MAKKFILTAYIGRFGPPHNGHAEVFHRARQKSDAVIVLIGSTNWARNPKNPWNYQERKSIIEAIANRPWHPGQKLAPVFIEGIRDFMYNDQLWIANVRSKVNACISKICQGNPSIQPGDVEVRITGADRDSSTFYLKFFPDWVQDLVDEDMEVSKFLTATTVREIYFGRTFDGNPITPQQAEMMLKSFVPPETIEFLRKFEGTPEYAQLQREHAFNIDYRKPYQVRKPKFMKNELGEMVMVDPGLPYEVMFQTVDNVIFQTGHVLLIKRRSEPGKGLWALPGGFVNPRERLFDAAIRELKEETRLKVPEAILRSSMFFKEDFDHPDRSLRGRTLTKTFFYELPDHVVDGKVVMPQIKGADDAEEAIWMPIDDVFSNPDFETRFFEDHHLQIEFGIWKLRSKREGSF